MTSFAIGRRAEDAAAEYLRAEGFEIIQQNYRTRFCEIDLVASKSDMIHFGEVKYRRTENQGNGLDYITSKKLEQMGLAAEYWIQEHEYSGEYHLSAIEVSGSDYRVTNFIESLS